MPERRDSPVAFGQRVLALLDTGSFTASYKYAVLLALIDAVLETTDEYGRPPTVVHGRDIGRRVFALYWPQARDFTQDGPLSQSRQRDVVQKIAEFRREHGIDDLAPIDRVRRQYREAFSRLERDIVATVVRYPIPLLQKVGAGGRAVERRFIYVYGWTTSVSPATVHRSTFDDRMHLVDGAGEHLSSLAGLLRPVIQRDWLDFVARRNDADVEELRLQEFLFGANRVGLRPLVEPLLALQDGRCFYCDATRTGAWEVDHFLPWARWPDNTLDNLVLAHERCNNDKRAALASIDHLARWWRRFDPSSSLWSDLDEIAVDVDWPRRPSGTQGAARALYLRQPDGAYLWVARPGRVETLDRARVLTVVRPDLGLAADDAGAYDPEA